MKNLSNSAGGPDWRDWRPRVCIAIAALSMLIFFAASVGGAENAFVRVNQLGYEAGCNGRAYLMATGSESGAIFHVLNARGVSVFSSSIGANLGSWEKFTVYALDFKVGGGGVFTIDVNGPMPATSPSFRIGSSEQLY